MKRKQVIIIGSIALIALIIAVYQSLTLFNNKDNERKENLIAFFVDGEPQTGNDFPTNKEFSHVRCYVDGEYRENITGTWENNSLEINGFTSKTDCNVYFVSLLRDRILEDNGGIAAITAKPRPNFDTVATTAEGMFAEPDGMMGGTSYYFRGTHDLNNNVLFAGHQWKVIRIDGAGNVRMIYNGTQDQFNEAGTVNVTGPQTGLATGGVAFNPLPHGSVNHAHVNYNNSPNDTTGVRGHVNAFFNSLSATAISRIVTTSYCNDRTSFCDTAGATPGCGTGAAAAYYGAYIRLVTNKNPTLACPAAFRISLGAALITADEIAFAGGVSQVPNSLYFLGNERPYWAMSPAWSSDVHAIGTGLLTNGRLNTPGTWNLQDVRPIISLNPNVVISSGNGSATAPFIIN